MKIIIHPLIQCDQYFFIKIIYNLSYKFKRFLCCVFTTLAVLVYKSKDFDGRKG